MQQSADSLACPIIPYCVGGFALWPSNYTNYSVAASPWKNGKGDVLREFADAANRWGIKICYYLQAADDGWGMYHREPKYTAATFLETTLGKLREVLTEYGPVNRFWFDGDGFGGTNNASACSAQCIVLCNICMQSLYVNIHV